MRMDFTSWLQAQAAAQENQLAAKTKSPYEDYENSTYVIVSKLAYLLGVPKRIFENEHEPPRLDSKWTLIFT